MTDTEHIQMAHGGGGQLGAELVEEVILPALGSQQGGGGLTDAAMLGRQEGAIVFTTDSYVIRPLVFGGGDIGKLSVCGTINDLAVAGASPRGLSMALVIREGLEISLLRQVLTSAGDVAKQVGVKIVTGDTKVVGRDGCDGLIINTAGVGEMLGRAKLGFDRIRQGDCVLVSGPLGVHGLAIMSLREGLSFSGDLESDCAPLNGLTTDLIGELGDDVHFMRDPTRGGLAATLAEVCRSAGRDVEISESAIPVNRSARAAAEMLGLDLLIAANEGKLVAVVAPQAAERAREILAGHRIAAGAAIIGTIGPQSDNPLVEMVTSIGGRRVVQMPFGQELPRIC